jgi:hypothetical protein
MCLPFYNETNTVHILMNFMVQNHREGNSCSNCEDVSCLYGTQKFIAVLAQACYGTLY